MRHQRAQKLALSQWDAPLCVRDRKALGQHLENCPACAAHIHRLDAVRQATLSLSSPSPTAGLDARMEHLIARATAKTTAPRSSRWVVYGIAAATAIIALALALPRLLDLGANAPSQITQRVIPQPASLPAAAPTPPVAPGQLIDADLDRARMWVEGPALWALHHADEREAAVELEVGRLGAEALPYAYVNGLRVACLGADILLRSGTMELWTKNGALNLAVYSGEVVVWDSSGEFADGQVLGPGHYERSAQQTTQARWTHAPLEDPKEETTSETTGEREVLGSWMGTVPLSQVRAALAQHKNALRTCYEKSLKRDPNLVVLAEAELEVDRQGEVMTVRLRGLAEEETLRLCLSQALKEIRFPPPRGGSVRLQLPLRLYPAN